MSKKRATYISQELLKELQQNKAVMDFFINNLKTVGNTLLVICPCASIRGSHAVASSPSTQGAGTRSAYVEGLIMDAEPTCPICHGAGSVVVKQQRPRCSRCGQFQTVEEKAPEGESGDIMRCTTCDTTAR